LYDMGFGITKPPLKSAPFPTILHFPPLQSIILSTVTFICG
jgi:hypothetical protein